MTQSIPLSEQKSVILNGSGNGQVNIGPLNVFQKWLPTMAATSTSTNNVEPTFRLYNQGVFLGGTYVGSNDSTGINNVTLYPGMTLLGVWSGGDPGATATLTVTGTVEVP